MSNLADVALQLQQLTPEVTVEFVLAISAEAQSKTPERLDELNTTLRKLSPRLQLA